MSRLANSETCQKCAKCCKEFTLWCDRDLAFRFKLLEHLSIEVREKTNTSGNLTGHVVFKIKCKRLRYDLKTEKYYCEIYDKERPIMCKEYPDTAPFSDWEDNAKECPIIRKTLKRVINEK